MQSASPTPLVRPVALCVFSRNDQVLVEECYDRATHALFYRPPGGEIEFGESSQQAVEREIREEIGAEVTGLQHLGTFESIFISGGRRGHEIVFVYLGELLDRALYDLPVVPFVEPAPRSRMVWKSIASFRVGPAPLYPVGLLGLLERIMGDEAAVSPAPPSQGAVIWE